MYTLKCKGKKIEAREEKKKKRAPDVKSDKKPIDKTGNEETEPFKKSQAGDAAASSISNSAR